MTLRRFLLLLLFLFSLALVHAKSVTNQVEQVLSVFKSSEFSRTQVLDRATFSRNVLHEETIYIVTDKASRKYTLVFISRAGGWATSPQGKKVDVISKEIALCDYKTGEVLLSVNNPCPLQKGVDVSKYGSFDSQEFIGKLKDDKRVSLDVKPAQKPVHPSESDINLTRYPNTNAEIKEKPDSNSDATLVKSPISDKLTWVAGNGAWRIMYYDADLKALFTELNKAYFGGCVKVLSIGWNCDMQDDVLASTWYYRDTKEITMTFNYNLDHLKDIKTLKAVMLHEMCHAVQYMVDPEKTDHSKDAHKEEIFLYEKNRLIKYFNEWVW